MEGVLANSYFKDFIIPLIAVLLTIIVKAISKNDTHARKLKWEDFAIGFDLGVSAIILIVTYSSKLALEISSSNILTHNCREKMAYAPWILLIYIIGLWGLSTFVRFSGWNSEGNEIRPFNGVIVPGILGLSSLYVAIYFFE